MWPDDNRRQHGAHGRRGRRSSAALLLIALLVSVVVQCDGAQAQQTSSVTLDEIVGAWRERERATRTLEYEWIETDLVVKGRDGYSKPDGQHVVCPPQDLTVRTTCRLKIDGQKMRYEVDGPHFVYEIGDYAPRLYVGVKDGKTMKRLFHKDRSGQDRFGAASVVHEDEGMFSDANSTPLLPIMMCYRPFSMHQGRFYDVSKCHITPGVGVVGQDRCLVLEQFIDLDIEGDRHQKNVLWVRERPPHEPMRMQVIMAGEARGQLDLEYAEEPGSGRFLSGWRHVAYSQGVPPGPGRRLQLQTEGRVTSRKFNVAIPESAFVLEDPPPGALVLDRRSDQQYLVREDGSKRPITQAERAAGYTHGQLLKTEPLFLAKPRPLWRRWEWIAWASLVLLLLAWGRLRRRRRMKEVA